MAERKQRGQYPEILLPVEESTARFAPGAAVPLQPASIRQCGPVELKPGDVVVVGSSVLRRGYYGSALDKLSSLCPDVLRLSTPHDDHALRILRQAGAAADRYEALAEKRALSQPERAGLSRQGLFDGDLSMVLLALPARMRSATIPGSGPIQIVGGTSVPSAAEAVSSATSDALSTLVRLLRKPR